MQSNRFSNLFSFLAAGALNPKPQATNSKLSETSKTFKDPSNPNPKPQSSNSCRIMGSRAQATREQNATVEMEKAEVEAGA